MENLGIDFFIYSEKDSYFWYTLDAGIYMKLFLKFFYSKTVDQRTIYFIKYDLGPRWKDRELWFHELFDVDDVSDETYDKIYFRIFENNKK